MAIDRSDIQRLLQGDNSERCVGALNDLVDVVLKKHYAGNVQCSRYNDDIRQHVMLRVLELRGKAVTDGNAFSYAYTTVRNEVHNYLAKESVRRVAKEGEAVRTDEYAPDYEGDILSEEVRANVWIDRREVADMLAGVSNREYLTLSPIDALQVLTLHLSRSRDRLKRILLGGRYGAMIADNRQAEGEQREAAMAVAALMLIDRVGVGQPNGADRDRSRRGSGKDNMYNNHKGNKKAKQAADKANRLQLPLIWE